MSIAYLTIVPVLIVTALPFVFPLLKITQNDSLNKSIVTTFVSVTMMIYVFIFSLTFSLLYFTKRWKTKSLLINNDSAMDLEKGYI